MTDEEDGLKCSIKYWIGKDYCNFIVKDFYDLDSPYGGKFQIVSNDIHTSVSVTYIMVIIN